MALSAKYEADFSSFYAAVSQAVTSLEAWANKGSDVEKQMDAVGNSLTDAPIVPATQAMTGAMDEFGVKSVNTMDNVANEAGGLSVSLGQIGGAIAAAFTVQQVTAFIGNVVETANKVGDLSVKLGISTEAVQRFQFAAEQGGTTIDNVGRSIQTMNDKLSEGGKGTIAALGQLGLDINKLRDSSPEQAFINIGDAIAGIENPMDRTRIAMELFGKSGSENIQMFLNGIKKVSDDTKVMSEETIARLKDASDAWTRFKNSLVIHTGEALGAVAKATSSWKEMGIAIVETAIPLASVREQVRPAIEAVEAWASGADTAEQRASDMAATIASLPEPIMKVSAAVKPVALDLDQASTAIGWLNVNLVKAKDAVQLVEPKLGTLSDATRNMARGTDDLDKILKATTQSTEVFNSGLRFTSEVVGELPQKFQAVTQAIGDMQTAQAASGPQMGTSTPGGSVNIGNVQFPMGIESALKNYTARYGTSSAAGLMGGGTMLPDFITWAKSMGLATSGAPSFPSGGNVGGVNQTINMNGLLGTNDPATRDLIKTMVGDAMAESLRGQRLLSSA